MLSVRPAFRSVPPPASSAGGEAIELAASAGLFLDPWQQDAVRDLLGEDHRGFWAATTGGLVCPRQNGKGSVIEALELAWLFLFGVELIFHSAHLFSTSSDAFRRIRGLIQNTPDLDRQVLRYPASHGQEGIELRSGQRLNFVTRSKSGGRGFPAPVVVLDEAFNLSEQAMSALVPTMSAQDNPFLLLTSSAPIEDPCSDELRRFMRRSRAGDVPRRCYIEYAAERDADYETQLRQANPGYGIRLNDDVIAEEQELLTPDAFRVERLGIVDLEASAAETVIPLDAWTACQVLDPARSDRVAYSIDASPDGGSASIAASDGLTALVLDHNVGTAWVAKAMAAHLAHKRGTVFLDPRSPAGALLVDLSEEGVVCEDVSPQQHAQACGGLLSAVNDRKFQHTGQPILDTAVRNATRRPYGDAWAWSRRLSSVDISPLVAVTLARWGALTVTPSTPLVAIR